MLSVQLSKPFCQYYGKCGGCSLQHIENYSEFKRNFLIDKLKEIDFTGKVYPTFTISKHSRRRVVLQVKNQVLGFFQYHSNNIIKINNCALLETELENLIIPLNKLLLKLNKKIIDKRIIIPKKIKLNKKTLVIQKIKIIIHLKTNII